MDKYGLKRCWLDVSILPQFSYSLQTNIDDSIWINAGRQGKQKLECKNVNQRPGLVCSHSHPARDLGAMKKGHELKLLPKCYFYLWRREGKALRGWMRPKGGEDLRREWLKIVPHPSHVLRQHHLVLHLNKVEKRCKQDKKPQVLVLEGGPACLTVAGPEQVMVGWVFIAG